MVAAVVVDAEAVVVAADVAEVIKNKMWDAKKKVLIFPFAIPQAAACTLLLTVYHRTHKFLCHFIQSLLDLQQLNEQLLVGDFPGHNGVVVCFFG
jgi:hypothetical protein